MQSCRVDLLKKSKESHSVLLSKLIKAKQKSSIVFIFEGDDDILIYNSFLNKIEFKKEYEFIIGYGKKQLISLYHRLLEKVELLDSNNKHILDNTYFFVDKDYDNKTPYLKQMFVLNAYSIENLLLDFSSLEKIMKCHLKLSGEYSDKRHEIMTILKNDYKKFSSIVRKICLYLFLYKTLNLNINFPKKINKYIKIEYNNISLKENYIPKNIENFDKIIQEHHYFVDYYNKLDDLLAIRGKYIYQFINKWFSSCIKNLNSDIKINVSSEFPSIVDIATELPVNQEFKKFLSKI